MRVGSKTEGRSHFLSIKNYILSSALRFFWLIMIILLLVGVFVISLNVILDSWLSLGDSRQLDFPNEKVSLYVTFPRYLSNETDDHKLLSIQLVNFLPSLKPSGLYTITMTHNSNFNLVVVDPEPNTGSDTFSSGFDSWSSFKPYQVVKQSPNLICNPYSSCNFLLSFSDQSSQQRVFRIEPLIGGAPGTVATVDIGGISAITPDKPVELEPILLYLPSYWIITRQAYINYLASPELVIGLAAVIVAVVALFLENKEKGRKQHDEELHTLDSLWQQFYIVEEKLNKRNVDNLALLNNLLDLSRIHDAIGNEHAFLAKRLSIQNVLKESRYTQRLLLEIGQELRNIDRTDKIKENITKILSFFVNSEHHPLVDVLTDIQRIIDSFNEVDNNDEVTKLRKKAVKLELSAIDLWRNYDELARDICIECFLRLNSISNQAVGVCVHKVFVKHLGELESLWQLVRDPSIRWPPILQHGAIEYQWSKPFSLASTLDLSPDTKIWLNNIGIQNYPFRIDQIESDPILYVTPHLPGLQKSLLAGNRACLFKTESLLERKVVSLALLAELQKPVPDIFPVWAPIFNTNAISLLEWLGQQLGHAWIEFIRQHPFVFFELPSDNDRRLLVALLTWYTGSSQLLLTHLQHITTSSCRKAVEKDEIFQLRSVDVLISQVDELSKDLIQCTNLSWQILLMWLDLRPMVWSYREGRIVSLPSIILVVPCWFQEESVQTSQLAVLHELWYRSSQLATHGVYLKMFVPDTVAGAFQLEVFQLSWQYSDLERILTERLWETGIGERFDAIFEQSGDPERNFHDELLEHSNVSFTKMMQLANETIVYHVTKNPALPDLKEDEWDAILARFD